MAEPYVQVEVFENWARMEFFHPKGNSLPSFLLSKMKNEIQELSNTEIKVLYLQSVGKHFCAGASFDELLEITNLKEAEAFFSGFAELIAAMNESKFLVFISQQGSAVGGGVGLLAGADYVIASEKGRAKLSELSIGIGPFAIQPALENKMGIHWYSMALNPKAWYSARESMDIGLIDEIVDQDALEDTMKKKIEEFCGYSWSAISALKEVRNKPNRTLMLEGAKRSASLLLMEEAQRFLNEFRRGE